jgi:hypothetical protein
MTGSGRWRSFGTYYPLDGLIGSESIASRVVHSTGAILLSMGNVFKYISSV